MKIFREIIIWLFERFAQDYWIEKQISDDREVAKIKFGCEDEDELDQYLIEEQQRPYMEAFEAGQECGYKEALEELN